ncbi:MAG: hypothetical protein JWQ40_781 [Segetibacter sp.]|nr:hypothetical protein [Segetibacter sp.]
MGGLILLINCNMASPSITLTKKLPLKDFPSGSSLEFYDNRVYLIGDDANHILILDNDYNPLDSITLFNPEQPRIPKYKKADLEASAIITTNGRTRVLVFGSAAVSNREVVMEFNPKNPADSIKTINTSVFMQRVKQAGIKEVNIEGAAIVKDVLVLCNRANETHTVNHFISTSPDYFNNQVAARLKVSRIRLPKQTNVAGISGLAYVPQEDLLLFTASTELTGNAYDDGEIGDSYIGWIKNISTQLNSTEISPDGMINLVEADKEFSGEKIESICVEKYEDGFFTLHLVSDNDKGQSVLFKVKLTLN